MPIHIDHIDVHVIVNIDCANSNHGDILSAIANLTLKGNLIMATLQEFVTTQTGFNVALDTALTDITGDIQTLNDKIAALVAAQGTLTLEQQAALDALVAQGAALGAKADALNALTPPPVPTV